MPSNTLGKAPLLKNPIPHLREATDAASKIAVLTRDLYVLNAELTAATQAKRMAYGVAGGVFGLVMLIMGFYWLTEALHETGWSPWVLMVLSLVIFGALSASCLFAALIAGKGERVE